MDKQTIEKIKSNPHYQELITKRSSFAWKLSAIVLVVYYSFILIIAFSPATLGASLSGGIVTVGIPVGVGIILISFILTGIYTKRANTEFDSLVEKLKEDLKKGDK